MLHVYFLYAPDFLGYADAVQMAGDHPEIIRTALKLKKAGNAVVAPLGGREVHPVNVRVGGFHRVPAAGEWEPVIEQLKWAREAALEMVRWTAQLPFPWPSTKRRNSPLYPCRPRRASATAAPKPRAVSCITAAASTPRG